MSGAIQDFVDELRSLIERYIDLVSTDDLICELDAAAVMVDEDAEDRENEK